MNAIIGPEQADRRIARHRRASRRCPKAKVEDKGAKNRAWKISVQAGGDEAEEQGSERTAVGMRRQPGAGSGEVGALAQGVIADRNLASSPSSTAASAGR